MSVPRLSESPEELPSGGSEQGASGPRPSRRRTVVIACTLVLPLSWGAAVQLAPTVTVDVDRTCQQAVHCTIQR